MIKEVAFFAHPTHDMEAAKRFYGEQLGLTPGPDFIIWAEFTTPDGQTIALDTVSAKNSEHPKPYLALETDDLAAEITRLTDAGVTVLMEPWSNHDPNGAEVCRMAIVMDPNGNPVMLHQNTR